MNVIIMHEDLCKTCQKCCIGELTGNPECAYHTSTGCTLEFENRDVGCRLFPFVTIEDKRFKNSHRTLIDLSCPYWYHFVYAIEDAKKSTEYTIRLSGKENK